MNSMRPLAPATRSPHVPPEDCARPASPTHAFRHRPAPPPRHRVSRLDSLPPGEGVTLADVVVSCSLLNAFKLVFDAAFLAPFPAVVRWFTACVAQPEFLAVLGPTALLQAPAAAPAKAAPPAKADKGKKADEAAPKKEEEAAPKKEAGGGKKKEKPPPPEKKPEPSPEEKAAKDKAKLIAKVVKEGGKKGVEIEGAADMGGLEFFCTTIESPEGAAATPNRPRPPSTYCSPGHSPFPTASRHKYPPRLPPSGLGPASLGPV